MGEYFAYKAPENNVIDDLSDFSDPKDNESKDPTFKCNNIDSTSKTIEINYFLTRSGETSVKIQRFSKFLELKKKTNRRAF